MKFMFHTENIDNILFGRIDIIGYFPQLSVKDRLGHLHHHISKPIHPLGLSADYSMRVTAWMLSLPDRIPNLLSEC